MNVFIDTGIVWSTWATRRERRHRRARRAWAWCETLIFGSALLYLLLFSQTSGWFFWFWSQGSPGPAGLRGQKGDQVCLSLFFFFWSAILKFCLSLDSRFFTLSPKGAQGPPGPPGKLVGVITLSAVHHCTIIVQWQGKKKNSKLKFSRLGRYIPAQHLTW